MTEPEILVVTNTIPPYSLHNVSYLAAPSGLTYHFRYERKLFHPTLTAAPRNLTDSLKNLVGMLVLRDFYRGTFIPLRKIRVHDVQDYGDFVFLDLELLNLVTYPSPHKGGVPLQLRECLHRQISDLLPGDVENNPGHHMSHCIMRANAPAGQGIPIDSETETPGTTAHWCRIVTLLSDLDAFRGVSFYRLTEVAKVSARSRVLSSFLGRGSLLARLRKLVKLSSRAGVVTATTLLGTQKGYRVTAGDMYSLSILQFIPSGAQIAGLPFNMSIQSNPSHLLPLRSSEVVDGSYDALRFYLQTQPTRDRLTKSYLVLESQQGIRLPTASPDQTPAIASPPFESDPLQVYTGGAGGRVPRVPANFIPIEIEWRCRTIFWRRWLPGVAVALALVFWFGADRFAPSGSVLASWNIKPEVFRYFTAFLLAWAFQTWSTFTGQFSVQSRADEGA